MPLLPCTLGAAEASDSRGVGSTEKNPSVHPSTKPGQAQSRFVSPCRRLLYHCRRSDSVTRVIAPQHFTFEGSISMRYSVRFPLLVAGLAIAAPGSSAHFELPSAAATSSFWNPPPGSSKTTAGTRRRQDPAGFQ